MDDGQFHRLLDSAYFCTYDDHMKIEFDPKKAAGNLKKHGVPFDEAASCLLDPLALVQEDPDACE